MSIKILLIEDEEITGKSLKKVMEKEGYETFIATDGEEGLKLFKLEKPDIVVTDIRMPKISGLDVMREIKQMSPSTEVILVTGHGDYEIAVLAIQEGALDYIKKPIDIEQLIFSLSRGSEKIIQRKKLNTKTNLLIIEDDKLTRDKLKNIFEKEDYKVFAAASGDEGLAIFFENKIDILLVDIKMPGKNGLEVLQEVKKTLNNDCEVIMLTGYGDEKLVIDALRDGAHNFIRKPVDIDQLILSTQKANEKLKLQRSYFYKERELELKIQIINELFKEKKSVYKLCDDSLVNSSYLTLEVLNVLPISIGLLDSDMKFDFLNDHFIKANNGYKPSVLEKDFISKLGMGDAEFIKLKSIITNMFELGSKEIVKFPIHNQNSVFIKMVSMPTNKGEKERVLIVKGEHI